MRDVERITTEQTRDEVASAASADAPASSVGAIILAAGAGSRYGAPKATVIDTNGTFWLQHAVDVMEGAGCDPVHVVLGAEVDGALETLRPDSRERIRLVVAADWSSGLAASLRAGLDAASATDTQAVLVSLVDLPTLTVPVALRVLGTPPGPGGQAVDAPLRSALRQARYDGRPGHPVLIGRSHWPELSRSLQERLTNPLDHELADRGARDYLREHGAIAVDCGDLDDGRDRDEPR